MKQDIKYRSRLGTGALENLSLTFTARQSYCRFAASPFLDLRILCLQLH